MTNKKDTPETSFEYASQWQLVLRRFSRHKLAVLSAFMLVLLYLIAIFAEFVSPQVPGRISAEFAYCPPQPPRRF